MFKDMVEGINAVLWWMLNSFYGFFLTWTEQLNHQCKLSGKHRQRGEKMVIIYWWTSVQCLWLVSWFTSLVQAEICQKLFNCSPQNLVQIFMVPRGWTAKINILIQTLINRNNDFPISVRLWCQLANASELMCQAKMVNMVTYYYHTYLSSAC